MLYIDQLGKQPSKWHLQVLRILIGLLHDNQVREEIVETFENSKAFKQAMLGSVFR